MADIFVSYTSSNRDWAHWIGKEIEALGHKPRIHEHEVRGGDDFLIWMNERLVADNHALCVFSDAYLKASYSQAEFRAALVATDQSHNFLLPIVVGPCELPPLIRSLCNCELFGLGEDEKRQRFRAFIGKSVAAPRTATTMSGGIISNIPVAVPRHFMGRDQTLADIETALGRHSGRVAITALRGLRGVGKTVLAATYAERHRDDYKATWWIRAETEATMRADLAGLGVRLGWVSAGDKEDLALTVVMERLRHEGDGILLIFDNATSADAIRPYLPRGGASRIIVTSNAHAWRDIAEPVEILVWPSDIGADYLIARTGRGDERAAAEALSEALGGLPLAHEQAAAYCERLEVPLAEYKRRFEAMPTRLLASERDAPVDYHDRRTVAKTFALAIDEAAKIHPAAEPLIVLAALLAPAPIPLFLFREAHDKLGKPLASALAEDGLDEMLAALRGFALVDRETIPDERDPAIATDTIRLHRLVREVAAVRCEGAVREHALAALIEVMGSLYPKGVFEDPNTWPRARRLDTLAMALVDNNAALPANAEQPAAYLMNRLAEFQCGSLGAYASARPFLERALAIREKLFGPNHSDTAESLHNLAFQRTEESDLTGARPLFERALAIRERTLGPEHPDTAMSLNHLGGLRQGQGDLNGARQLFERALAIREIVLGPEHPNTATSLVNLGTLLQKQGDLTTARPLCERALAIHEKVLGPEHPDTAKSLGSVASLAQDQGDCTRARQLFERALAIHEKVLGPEHPDTATNLSALSGLLQDEGDLTGARLLCERALTIRERTLGLQHWETAKSLHNLGVLLGNQGNMTRARPLLQRALAITAKSLGPKHPSTILIRKSLASLRSGPPSSRGHR